MESEMAMAAYYSTSSRSVPPSNTTSAYGSVIPPVTSGVSYLSGSSDTNFFSAMPTEPPSSSIVAGSGCFASVLQSQQQGSLDLYVPQCEDAAELEWLSQFMEDSFSDMPNEIGWGSVSPPLACAEQVHTDPPATALGALSMRSKAVAWSSSVAPSHRPGLNSPSSSTSSSYEFPPSELSFSTGSRRNGKGKKGRSATAEGGAARRCTHCASEKTPQWRTGPLGPKTLCNACGVRYKSGRLVPEYRPAASPTFVLAQHSNSHRKVMELRRQKEFLRHHQTDTSSVSRSEFLYDDSYGVS